MGIGKTGRSRALGGERPSGAATCGGERVQGKDKGERERPVRAASFRQQSTPASTQPPQWKRPALGWPFAASLQFLHGMQGTAKPLLRPRGFTVGPLVFCGSETQSACCTKPFPHRRVLGC